MTFELLVCFGHRCLQCGSQQSRQAAATSWCRCCNPPMATTSPLAIRQAFSTQECQPMTRYTAFCVVPKTKKIKLSNEKQTKTQTIQHQVSPPLHQQRPLEDKKMPTPNGGSPPAHPQNMKPRPEGSPSLAVLSNHHGVGGPTQAPAHGGSYPVYQNSGGHQPPLQVHSCPVCESLITFPLSWLLW